MWHGRWIRGWQLEVTSKRVQSIKRSLVGAAEAGVDWRVESSFSASFKGPTHRWRDVHLRSDPRSGPQDMYDVTQRICMSHKRFYTLQEILRPSVARCVKDRGREEDTRKQLPIVAPKCWTHMPIRLVVIIEIQLHPDSHGLAHVPIAVSGIWRLSACACFRLKW